MRQGHTQVDQLLHVLGVKRIGLFPLVFTGLIGGPLDCFLLINGQAVEQVGIDKKFRRGIEVFGLSQILVYFVQDCFFQV